MSSKFLRLDGLKETIGSKNPIKAKQIVESVCTFFDEDLTSAELALALEVLFHDQTGTVAFVNKTLRERKLFKDSNVVIFELWTKIIQNSTKEVSFDAYTENILQTCETYILSTIVSAKEKERAAIVLQEVFQNDLVHNIDISHLVVKLLDIFKMRNKQSTFLQQVYKLLGTIARDSPDSISNSMNPDVVRNVFLNSLETTLLNEETLQFNTLTGALDGLNLFLMNFAPSPVEDEEICRQIYVCVKRLADPMDSSKKTTFRAALELFKNHSILFSAHIFKDFAYWHSCLTKWLSSSMYDDRRKGIYAIEAFHRVMSAEILQRNDESDQNILLFFMNYFRAILESSESRSYESRIAIRGFGMMGGPCKRLLPDMLQEILLLVIQRTELISIAEDNELRESLEHFPDYMEALSQIIILTTDTHAIQMLAQNIENIAVRLIQDFHYLSRAHTQLVVNSLSRAFFYLSNINGTLLDDVLQKVILQGVIWTCSHKLVYDANLDWITDIDWKDNITYKSYIPLWEGLLIDSYSHTYDKPLVTQKIFNQLMKTLFLILEKLDLRTKRRVFVDEDGTDKEFYFCDPNIDLSPVKPKDFHIFFNIVDLYRELFWVKFRNAYFFPWIQEFCMKMIQYAMKNPLVSGFLKLLEVGLVKANYLQYFDNTVQVEMQTLRLQLSYFLKSLIIKCQRVSGELQISCLELILKYPCIFYEDYIINLIPIFVTAFDFGKSMIFLAKVAIGALEKMSDSYSESLPDMKKFYKSILPCLDSYLQSRGFQEYVNPEIVKNKNKQRIRKNLVQKITETELVVVQRRIISFLGKLNPEIAALMISGQQKGSLVKWEIDQFIRLKLHFPTMQPNIYLDTIMPRICELAVTSSDRKTKIAACELVHTVILYLLGVRKYKGAIWKELCNCMLVLGSDSDGTVQQMFEPMLKQIMHFMSKYENLNDGVTILMDALMHGISNSANCSIRDLSAVCLREFVEWSIKQTTPEELAASPVSIKLILDQLKMFSFDSDGSKRNGAALAFNNLYRKLREEESICDMFFVDLLHTFCVNFKLSEELSSISVTDTLNSDLEQVSLSLDHIVRVLKERNYLFNKTQPNRSVPTVMVSGTLKDIIIFLIKESGTKLMNYRHKCIEMIEILAPYVLNITSFAAFLTKYTTPDMLREVCEGKSDGTGIKARPSLEFIKNDSSQPQMMIYSWLQNFLASLDCYTWLLGDHDLQKPDQLFHSADIFQVISYYLNNICWKNVHQIFHDMNSNISIEFSDTIQQITNDELTKIETIRTIIVVRIMDFIAKVHQAGCANKFPEDFWSANKVILRQFLVQIIFEPQKLDFDFRSNDIAQKLPQRFENLLRALRMHCFDKDFVRDIQSEIIEVLKFRFNEICKNVQAILSSDAIAEQQLNTIRGINFVCRHLSIFSDHDDVKRFLKNLSIDLFSDLFLGIKKSIFDKDVAIERPRVVKKFANQLMAICFVVNAMAPNVVHCILDTTTLKATGVTSTITHGEHFFTIYKKTIFEQCNEGFIENVITRLLQNIYPSNVHLILKLFTELTDFMYKYKSSDRPSLRKLVDIILIKIPKILESVAATNEELMFIKIMLHIANSSPYPLHTYRERAPVLESWILERLRNQNNSLENKSRIIFLVPLIVGPDDKNHEELSKALEDVQRQHLPLRSNEFAKNSLDETGLKSVFASLLNTLVSSQSYVILEFLVKCTAIDKKHIVEWMIRLKLKTYMQLLSPVQQVVNLKRIFEITCGTDLEPNVRLNIFNRFLLIMIQNSQESSLCEFYTAEIKKIDEMTDTSFGSTNSGWIVEQALATRIIGFSLVEAMFGCLPKDKMIGPRSSIATSFSGKAIKGTEMVGLLTKKSYNARLNPFLTDNSKTRELFRIYQCAAYKCVCSLVSNTQDDLKFYNRFLFQEKMVKNELIWQNLIDCSNEYVFDGQEAEDFQKIKDRFTSIRKLNTRAANVETRQPTMSSKHLQTQNIFGSSLSQDVTKIDLNYSTIRTNAEVLARIEQSQGVGVSVQLQRNVLNNHEAMPILCGVIQHIFENGIAPVPTNVENKRPYVWIDAIANTIENSENHKNIRIFLAQMVENCRNIFKHYSYSMMRPILQVLVDECAGNQLNYFITDLVAMILSWPYKPSTPEEIRLASLLLKFLMKNAWHEQKPIFKFNLEIIQSVMSLWKDIVTPPSQLLLDLLTRSQRPDSRENNCGIVLLGIVFANGLIPWTQDTKNFFISGIFVNLTNDYTIIYQPASNVMGMMLNILKLEQDVEIMETLLPELVNKIKTIGAKNDKKHLEIIYGIHKHYLEIVDSFREIISYKLPLAVGTIKRMYLEIFLSRTEAYETVGIYKVLVSIGISNVLKDLEYQNLGLHIVNRTIRKMDETEVMNIFPLVEECIDSRKSECRDIAYEIMIYIAVTFGSTLGNKAGQLLLKGLIDFDSKIQNRIFNFWSREANLSHKVEERLLFLISDYSVKCEKQFLGFCTQLLLELSIEHPESKKQVFEFESNSDSKLLEYRIDPHFRHSFSLPPLFAESENTRRNLLTGSHGCDYIRETPGEYLFEPTQDPVKMTATSQCFTLPTQSSLPFVFQPQVLDRRSQKVKAQESSEHVDLDKTFDRLRRRFLKDKEKETRNRVLKVIDYKVRVQRRMAAEVKKKEGQIVLYRRYRNGDYPDLLINNLAFLMPLQGLVKWDAIISRQIFVSIFSSILTELGPESKMFIVSVSSKIQAILENARICDPIIFATFLEIALLRPAQFDISPEIVAMISKASNMLTIGAIYLENRIDADWETDVMSAKTSSTIPIDEQHWLHLSEIYNSLAEYDIVSSIFADKIKTDPRLAEAIELKANGHYQDAQNLLLKIIDRRVQVEHYYAYIAYYECFLEMGLWSELSQTVQNQVDDFEEFWSDDYNFNFLLPNLLQSELQLILQNKSRSEDFLRVLESWMVDSVKSEHLKTTFCEELMMLHIANRDYLQARVFSECYLKTFIIDWSVISTLNNKLRLKNLLNAQKVAEIDHYALLLIENFNETAVMKLNSRWEKCVIKPTDSLRFWNCITAYRSYIGHLIRETLANVNSEGMSAVLEDTLSNMHIQLFDAALHQKNYGLTEKILEQLYPNRNCERNNFNIQYEIATTKRMVLESQQKVENDRVNKLKETWIKTKEILQSRNLEEDVRLNLEVLKLHTEIGENLLESLTFGRLNKNLQHDLVALTDKSTAKELNQRIFDQSLWSLEKSAEICDSVLNKSDLQSTASNSFYRLAQFCYDHHDDKRIEHSIETDKMIIKFVFLAMQHGSKEARQLFPCILQLSSIEDGTLRDFFRTCSSDVPEWMFLAWIPQILSQLEFDSACYLDDIVKRIAFVYPNALVYPFRVWYDGYVNKKESIQFVVRSEIQEIFNSLKNPITDKFIENFNILCVPEALLITYLSDLSTYIRNQADIRQEQFIFKLDQLVNMVFIRNEDIQGSAYRSIQKYKEAIEQLNRFNVQNEHQELNVAIHKIRDMVRKAMQKFEKNILMDIISPWLSRFQWCGEETFLELPGQYSGNRRPNVLDHIKIVKFDKKLEVLQSLRRPFRITVYGSNAKSYDFLIKYGEELKQDQRIQQILYLMSEKLAEDRNCSNHNMFIRTFKVIPIGQNCGMLRWVLDTISIQSFLIKTLTRREPNGEALLNRTFKKYVDFIQNARPDDNVDTTLKLYGQAAVHYKRDERIASFRNLENDINPEILKFGLIDIAVSPESFFVLRHNFATSLSAMNIAHWILGIGDRHLLNILMSTKDGSLTGIDFGITFGMGVRDLFVPELVPFRLTSHIVQVMTPMGTSGVIFKCMANVLRVFRNSKRVLMACMEVFVREPTVNWLNPVRTGRAGVDQLEHLPSEWQPKDRIEIAKQKLLGHNPMHLLEKELLSSVQLARYPEYIEGYRKILRGHPQFNIRSRTPETDLTVEQQVKCLIDLAIDPAVLSAAYEGFLPWI